MLANNSLKPKRSHGSSTWIQEDMRHAHLIYYILFLTDFPEVLYTSFAVAKEPLQHRCLDILVPSSQEAWRWGGRKQDRASSFGVGQHVIKPLSHEQRISSSMQIGCDSTLTSNEMQRNIDCMNAANSWRFIPQGFGATTTSILTKMKREPRSKYSCNPSQKHGANSRIRL